MKYNILKSVLVVLFLLFATQNVFAETIAVVLKVKGSVSIQRGDKASSQKIKRGFRLENGDKIVTGKKSFAALRFIDDKSLLRVRSNSSCIINGKKEKNQILKNVFLEVGTIFARVTKQRGKFEVSTPTSVASVKGTEWYTEQTLEGGTFYYCEEGVLEVTNDAGSALVKEGETGYVADSKTPPTVSKTTKKFTDEDDLEEGVDKFEFEFENEESGQKKRLEFKLKKKE